MKVHKTLARTVSGLLAVMALVCAAEFKAGATPPSGIAFTPVVQRDHTLEPWIPRVPHEVVTR